MAVAHHSARARRRGASPLTGPLLLFAAATLTAAAYIAYVLWPRWPDVPVGLDAPSLPITVAGVTFNIEPAAIRSAGAAQAGHASARRSRLSVAVAWSRPIRRASRRSARRSIPTSGCSSPSPPATRTLPLMQRVQNIYPRYLVAEPTAGPDGLTLRGFRDGTPYQGEELVFESRRARRISSPAVRCTAWSIPAAACWSGASATPTLRCVSRATGSTDWRGVAAGIDKLIARLHPN